MTHKQLLKIVLSFILCLNYLSASSKKSICLNMIVKDESPVICRCLESIKPLIDYWVIVDTGSTDNTKEMIQTFMQKIPGELHERSWIDFAHNRNEALELAKNKGDYVLFIDADEILSWESDFVLPDLDKDFYYIPIRFGGLEYARVLLINNALNWTWTGVVHEYIYSPEATNFDTLKGIQNIVYTDGNRSQDPLKYLKDANILEKALLKDPDNPRYLFYLAQSYKDAGALGPALETYKKQFDKSGWEEEMFWSLYQIGLLQKMIGYNADIFLESYHKAYLFRPSRIEPLYQIAYHHRTEENYLAGYEIAKQGLLQRKSSDRLFVEKWIYDYGLLLEFSICAYWVEHYEEALLASYLILAQKDLPHTIQDCVQNNLSWISLKLQKN